MTTDTNPAANRPDPDDPNHDLADDVATAVNVDPEADVEGYQLRRSTGPTFPKPPKDWSIRP